MTLVILHKAPDRILCLTDTLVSIRTAETERTTPVRMCGPKVRVSRLGPFLFTGRGGVEGLRTLAPLVDCFASFDELRDHLSGTVPSPISLGDLLRIFGLEAIFAGWSPSAARMVATLYQWQEGQVHARDLPDGLTILPEYSRVTAELKKRPPPSVTGQRMFAMATALHRITCNDRHWRLAFGGTAHLTTLTPDGGGQEEVGRFPDHDVLAAQFAEAGR